MVEIWKDVVGFEPYLEVSNFGRLKSKERICGHRFGGFSRKKGKLLSIQNNKGYSYVYVNINGKGKNLAIHRLVAMAFIQNEGSKREVNHINGITNDNRVENLEWVTAKENTNHAWKSGLCENIKISSRKSCIERNSKLVLNKEIGIFHSSAKEAAEFYGYKHSTLKCKLNGSVKNNTKLIYV